MDEKLYITYLKKYNIFTGKHTILQTITRVMYTVPYKSKSSTP